MPFRASRSANTRSRANAMSVRPTREYRAVGARRTRHGAHLSAPAAQQRSILLSLQTRLLVPLALPAFQPLFRSLLHNIPRRSVILETGLLDRLNYTRTHHREELPPVTDRRSAPPLRRFLFDHPDFRAAQNARKPSHWIISAEALRREPRYSNNQFVWQYNRRRVPIGLCKRILQVLDRQPMQLGHLLKRIGGDGTSPAILSLACADVLEIDLASHPIDRTTIVRLRRYPPVR